MLIRSLICILFLLLLFACNRSTKDGTSQFEGPTIQLKEIITRYYTIDTDDGVPKKGSIMECFSCNQGLEFDRDGKELVLRFYKADLDSLYGFERYNYNEQGFKISADYFENDTIVSRYEYELDAQGRIVIAKAIDQKSGQMLYGYQHKYDAEGLIYETGNLNAAGQPYEYYRRTFNAKGLPVTENIFDLNDSLTFEIKYEYRPVDVENWKEQIAYYNGILSEIRYREFVYFDF